MQYLTLLYPRQSKDVFDTVNTSLWTLGIRAGTKTGKTTFSKQLLANASVMIDEPPQNIVYFYSEYR